MKFRDVLDVLENGYRIRRAGWREDRCLDYHEGRVEAFEGDQIIDDWSPDAEELFADDWEIGDLGRTVAGLSPPEQAKRKFRAEHSGHG